MIFRKKGALYALLQESQWARALEYIDENIDEPEDPRPSKLARELSSISELSETCVAGDDLRKELRVDRQGSSLLRELCTFSPPAALVAALCQLGETAVRTLHQHEYPLHAVICANTWSEESIAVLLKAYPGALLHRNTDGRTPVHLLFVHHVRERSPRLVQALSVRRFGPTQLRAVEPNLMIDQDVCSAAAVPDTDQNWLPLHYAVMNGASLQAIHVLLKAHNAHATDRLGRTALHLYLSGVTDSWWQHEHSAKLVQMLNSSRVARTTDAQGRQPMHWAVVLAAKRSCHGQAPNVELVQAALEPHIDQLVQGDANEQTPLLLWLETICEMQKETVLFDPSLLQILLQKRIVATHDDAAGRLPLHAAVQAGADSSTLQALLQVYPAALIHTCENHSQVPLHLVSHRLSTESTKLLVQRWTAGKHAIIDGKMAMKMDDASGMYPLHMACRNKASLEVLKILYHSYPLSALQQSPDLPLHCLLTSDVVSMALSADINDNETASQAYEYWQTMPAKVDLLLRPLFEDGDSLKVADSLFGMQPLHIALLFEAVPYVDLLRLLQKCPSSAYHYSSQPIHSPLDTHDTVSQLNSKRSPTERECIRELLYSFAPKLESHRHREGLLTRCVQLVLEELHSEESFHLRAQRELQQMTQVADVEDPAAVGIVLTGSNVVPPHSPRDDSHQPTKMSPKRNPKFERLEAKKTVSIYDDDDAKLDYSVTADDQSLLSDEFAHEDESVRQSDVVENDEWSDNDGETLDDHHVDIYPLNAVGRPALEGLVDYGPDPVDNMAVFEEAKRKIEEEKKDDNDLVLQNDRSEKLLPIVFSEVALRIWTFFALYCDHQNPSDNYAQQVGAVLDALNFETAQRLSLTPLPEIASQYIGNESIAGLTFRDRASPKCRELIHKTCYFLGKYEFVLSEDSLQYQEADGSSVNVGALEWIFTTEQATSAEAVGVSEAKIWATGVPPSHVGTTFKSSSRPVSIKFMKRKHEFDNELEFRRKLTADCTLPCLVPIDSYYNAFGDRRDDETYKNDTSDDRFKEIGLISTKGLHRKSLPLRDYPYAIAFAVNPHQSSLYSYIQRVGALSSLEASLVARSVITSTIALHKSGVVHGNIAARQIAYQDSEWKFDSLGCSHILRKQPKAGGIAKDGCAQFSSYSLPPEMFVQLTPPELKAYWKYWNAVEAHFGCKIEESIIAPHVDVSTGDAIVIRCHFDEVTEGRNYSMPPLPYSLLPIDGRMDTWAIGQLVHVLMTGCSVFPSDAWSRKCTNPSPALDWEAEKTRLRLASIIDDPLAQDFLSILLAVSSERPTNLGDLLRHPFLCQDLLSSALLERERQRLHQLVSKDHRLLDDKAEKSFNSAWLEGRQLETTFWDFDLLKRIHVCPSHVISRMESSRGAKLMPVTSLVLPYNKESEHSATAAHDLGVSLLRLVRMMHYVTAVKRFGHAAKPVTCPSLTDLDLPSAEFEWIQEQVDSLAYKHVELSRSSPLALAMKVLAGCVRDVEKCICGDNLWLHLVDDYTCQPALNHLYPLLISVEEASEHLKLAILPLYACTRYALCVDQTAGSTLLSLLTGNNSAMPPPSSWQKELSSLSTLASTDDIVSEMGLLEEALSDIYQSRCSISSYEQSLTAVLEGKDVRGNMAGLYRVNLSGVLLWTTKSTAESLEERSKATRFEDALKLIQRP